MSWSVIRHGACLALLACLSPEPAAAQEVGPVSAITSVTRVVEPGAPLEPPATPEPGRAQEGGPVLVTTRGATRVVDPGAPLDPSAAPDPRPAQEGGPRPTTATARRVAQLGVPLDPSAAPSPDGRFMAVLQTRPRPILWIVPADGGEPFAFREMWAAYKPRWSPSGNRVGFVAAVGPPRVWTVEVDPESGRPMAPPRLLIRTFAHDFAFSPDGERIALVAQRASAAGTSQIDVVSWESRASRTVLRADGVIHRLDWSPDGRWLYYGVYTGAEGEDAFRVMRVPAAGGRPEMVANGEFLGQSGDGGYLLLRPAPPTAAGSPTTDADAPIDVEGPGGADPLAGAERPALRLEIADPEGAPLWRLELDPGPLPRWGADASSLIRVVPQGDGDAIWRYELADTSATVAGPESGGPRP